MGVFPVCGIGFDCFSCSSCILCFFLVVDIILVAYYRDSFQLRIMKETVQCLAEYNIYVVPPILLLLLIAIGVALLLFVSLSFLCYHSFSLRLLSK